MKINLKKNILKATAFIIGITLMIWETRSHLISLLRGDAIGAIVLILIYCFGKIIQRDRMAHWKEIRKKGKQKFILYDFVLLRGGIISLLLLLILSYAVTISIIIICSVIPLLGVCAFVGNEIWKQCEMHYSQKALKSVSDKMKVMSN